MSQNKPKYKTLKELKKSSYKPKSIQQEMADNLRRKITNREPLFEGIIGYENTVIPDVERAILSGHNINLLGLRGQAKTRIARQLTELLDPWIPTIEGSEINDDPINPISSLGKKIIEEMGDSTPLHWLSRDERFFEKLATPDVTVADLIGDIDPLKATQLKLSYADERVIHFGMIPRAHRCIFALNELPDLQARLQVSLFSILQEKEVQIRGFNIRLPLNVFFVFTANPEDYTNRGSIVTPLKDRIGTQVLTHYPLSIQISKRITLQEANIDKTKLEKIKVSPIALDLLEQIAVEARKSEYVDPKSGVSSRMSITAYENLISTAERRMLMNHETNTQVRLTDFVGVIAAINGKVELVYEGEQIGIEKVAFNLLNQAVKTLFPRYFPAIKKIEKTESKDSYATLMEWILADNELELLETDSDRKRQQLINAIPGLDEFFRTFCKVPYQNDFLFLSEFLFWGLSEHGKISRYRILSGFRFQDSIGSFINRL